MYQQRYYVDKTTDTFADTLLAYGVAALLDRVIGNRGADAIRIRDEGATFTINLPHPIQPNDVQMPWFCDLPFIATKSKKPPADWLATVVDYEAERQRNAEYFAALQQLPKEVRRSGATLDEFPALAQVTALKPIHEWPIITQINQMGAITAYVQVLESWSAVRTCFPEFLQLLLAWFAETPNPQAQAATGWRALAKRCGLKNKENATPVQVLNPAMGKGINRTKADGADKLDNPDSFWPLEFLKFWGLFQAGVPRVVKSAQGGGRGPRDRKTYVLHPKNITLKTHREVYNVFTEGMWTNTAVKMDVLAALRYTDVFLAQWLAGQVDDAEWGLEPGNYMQGLTIAFYKDMGSAVTLLNLSEMALPRWMRVTTPEQGEAYRSVLEEHRRVVSSLDEGKSDEYRLLNDYRNFLSGHDLASLFRFTAGYSTLTMSRIERGSWAPRFLATHLEVLIMEHDNKLKPILEAPGFQNLARAIRRSTVIPQYHKAKGQRGPYDIRYGLGTGLLRQAAYPDRFVQALGKFLHDYNQENAQINERYKGNPPVRRATVTTDDIAQVIELVDKYGSQTVANLLVAFGYAREVSEQELDEAKTPALEEGADVEA